MSVAAPPAPPVEDPHDDPGALIEEARERTRRRHRRNWALALAVVLAGAGVYLGLTAGGAAPSASVNVRQPAQPLASGPPPDGFEVWFVRGYPGGGCCSVFPSRRKAEELEIPPELYDTIDWAKPDALLLEALIAALIAGPSPDEVAAANWGSVLHPGTRPLGISVDNGIVTIDIASDVDASALGSSHDEYGMFATYDWFNYEDGGGLLPLHRLSQLVFTVTQFPSVEGVKFKLDGQPVEVRIGDPIGGDRAGPL
jgi:hypothetical protein